MEQEKQQSFWNSYLKQAGTAASVLSGAGAFFSDFLLPIAPLGLYLSIILISILMLSACVRVIPIGNKFAKDIFGEYWCLPFSFGLIISIAVLGGAYLIAKSTTNDDVPGVGILGTHSDDIRKIQDSIFNIERDVKSIAKNTEEIAKTGKKETSDDPRKEIANLGKDWSEDDFIEAIIKEDNRLISLYEHGGMKLRPKRDPFFILEILKHNDYIEILDRLYAKNAIDTGSLNQKASIYNIDGKAKTDLEERIRRIQQDLEAKKARENSERLERDLARIRSGKLPDPPPPLEFDYLPGDLEISFLSLAILNSDEQLTKFLLSKGVSSKKYCAGFFHRGDCAIVIDPVADADALGISVK